MGNELDSMSKISACVLTLESCQKREMLNLCFRRAVIQGIVICGTVPFTLPHPSFRGCKMVTNDKRPLYNSDNPVDAGEHLEIGAFFSSQYTNRLTLALSIHT